jgi:hypothetical protein
MKKYMAGGKAVGSAGCVKEDCSQTGKAFSAMLANRDRQMADLWTTPLQNQQQQTPLTQNKGQIVVHKPVIHAQNKSADIDMILNGDF